MDTLYVLTMIKPIRQISPVKKQLNQCQGRNEVRWTQHNFLIENLQNFLNRKPSEFGENLQSISQKCEKLWFLIQDPGWSDLILKGA